MQLRKLTAAEVARLCSCGLWPHEPRHDRSCRIWRDKEMARLHAKVATLQARIAALAGPHVAARRILVIPDPPTWYCATCSGNSFARSVRDPSRCIRCARGQERVA